MQMSLHYVTVALYLAPTNLQLVILSRASLEVKWGPAPDADQSPLTYTVTAEGVNAETKRVTTTPGDSSVTLSSLQELTAYNVSVQAVNSGGPSRSLTAAVRIVTVGQLGRTGVQLINSANEHSHSKRCNNCSGTTFRPRRSSSGTKKRVQHG